MFFSFSSLPNFFLPVFFFLFLSVFFFFFRMSICCAKFSGLISFLLLLLLEELLVFLIFVFSSFWSFLSSRVGSGLMSELPPTPLWHSREWYLQVYWGLGLTVDSDDSVDCWRCWPVGGWRSDSGLGWEWELMWFRLRPRVRAQMVAVQVVSV